MGAERVPLQGSYSLVVFLLDTVLLGLNKRGIGKEGGWGRRERRGEEGEKEGGWGRRERRREGGGGRREGGRVGEVGEKEGGWGRRERGRDRERGREGRVEGEMMRKD